MDVSGGSAGGGPGQAGGSAPGLAGGSAGAGIAASLAGRYAAALFELARDARQVEAVEASLSRLTGALAAEGDLRRLVASPVVDRAAAGRAMAGVADALALDGLTRNFLGVLAANRRLPELPRIARALRALAAAWRGEVAAEVTSAHPLAPDQVDALKDQLRRRVGREVALDLQVDPALLGGLVVQLGSTRIDSSIRTRLDALARRMRG